MSAAPGEPRPMTPIALIGICLVVIPPVLLIVIPTWYMFILVAALIVAGIFLITLFPRPAR